MTSAASPASARREPELAGQTVVVIGGSAGIGLETARRARAEGAEVIIAGRNPGSAAAVLGRPRLAPTERRRTGAYRQATIRTLIPLTRQPGGIRAYKIIVPHGRACRRAE